MHLNGAREKKKVHRLGTQREARFPTERYTRPACPQSARWKNRVTHGQQLLLPRAVYECCGNKGKQLVDAVFPPGRKLRARAALEYAQSPCSFPCASCARPSICKPGHSPAYHLFHLFGDTRTSKHAPCFPPQKSRASKGIHFRIFMKEP